jgi:hypothetical protein
VGFIDRNGLREAGKDKVTFCVRGTGRQRIGRYLLSEHQVTSVRGLGQKELCCHTIESGVWGMCLPPFQPCLVTWGVGVGAALGSQQWLL